MKSYKQKKLGKTIQDSSSKYSDASNYVLIYYWELMAFWVYTKLCSWLMFEAITSESCKIEYDYESLEPKEQV